LTEGATGPRIDRTLGIHRRESVADGPSGSGEAKNVSTFEVLKEIGFAEDSSEQQRGFSFTIGRFKLWALPCINRWFVPIVLVTGHLYDGNTLSEICDELPAEAESREQVIAYISWCLDKAMGRTFKLAFEPPWLVEGRGWRQLLPWDRKRAAYEGRPHCHMKRDWAKLALRELAQNLSAVDDESAVSFGFDGTVLRIACGRATTTVAAEGRAWPSWFSAPTQPAYGCSESPNETPRRVMRTSLTLLENLPAQDLEI
jgi:hypothetical protein